MIKTALFAGATCLSLGASAFASPGDVYRIQAAELEARAQLRNPESIEYLESTIFGEHGNANRFVCGYVHRKDAHAASRYIWSNLAPHKIIDEQVYPLPMVFNAQWNTICRDDSPNSEPLAAVQTTDPKQSSSVPQPALPVANPNIAYKVAQVPPPRGSVPAESENWQPIGPDTPID